MTQLAVQRLYDTMREFQKVVKDRIKMVLKVILGWKTTFLVKKNFFLQN